MTTYNFGYLGNNATSGDRVKERVGVTPPTNTTFGPNGNGNSPLELACQEASAIVSAELMYYDSNFDGTGTETSLTIPQSLMVIVGDFAASVFKRRLNISETTNTGPFTQGMKDGNLNATSWFSQAMTKLKGYIKAKYIKPKFHIYTDDGSTSQGYIGGYKEVT